MQIFKGYTMNNRRKYWRREMVFGVMLSLIIITLITCFPMDKQMQLWAITMTIIMSIYIGFALKDQGKKLLVLQIVVAAFFLPLTLMGLWITPWFLVAAFILHGFWDLLHDYKIIKTRVMPWYPDFCMVVDWVLGLYLAIDIIL